MDTALTRHNATSVMPCRRFQCNANTYCPPTLLFSLRGNIDALKDFFTQTRERIFLICFQSLLSWNRNAKTCLRNYEFKQPITCSNNNVFPYFSVLIVRKRLANWGANRIVDTYLTILFRTKRLVQKIFIKFSLGLLVVNETYQFQL